MGVYNVVSRDSETRELTFNCNHRHRSLVDAIRCQDSLPGGELFHFVEVAARNQALDGEKVNEDLVDQIHEAMQKWSIPRGKSPFAKGA